MTATIHMDQATKLDVLKSTDPSSVKTNLRTAQNPNHAPDRMIKASRKYANCSLNSNAVNFLQWI